MVGAHPRPSAFTFPAHRCTAPSTCHAARGFAWLETTYLGAQGRCQASCSSSRPQESVGKGPAPMPSAGRDEVCVLHGLPALPSQTEPSCPQH